MGLTESARTFFVAGIVAAAFSTSHVEGGVSSTNNLLISQPDIPTQVIPTPLPNENIVVQPQQSWEVQGVSTMKLTKDRVCSPLNQQQIETVIAYISELGATHVALETPYDDPTCGNAVEYTRQWVEAARHAGLSIIHRHMFTMFEGIYDVQKDNSRDYPQMIYDYIVNHTEFFAPGDIIMPLPEPDSSGISGFNCGSDCFFNDAAEFNSFIRNTYRATESAINTIGMTNSITLSCCSFSGFTVAGLDNPDWQDGILEEETQEVLGNVISIDHYPQGGATMEDDLEELFSIHPEWTLEIGEWGPIDSDNPQNDIQTTFDAFLQYRNRIRTVTYWHIGGDGVSEQLLYRDGPWSENVSFVPAPAYETVQEYFMASE